MQQNRMRSWGTRLPTTCLLIMQPMWVISEKSLKMGVHGREKSIGCCCRILQLKFLQRIRRSGLCLFYIILKNQFFPDRLQPSMDRTPYGFISEQADTSVWEQVAIK